MKAKFLALAALVLGLASCQQEFNDVAQLGGEVDFQLKVDAAELATRAGADGVNDTNNAYDSAFGAIDYLQAGNGVDEYRVDWTEVDLRYSLEVYDADADFANTTDVKPVKDRMVKIVDAYEPVVFDLRLVPGRNYHFVVFADFVPNGASNDPNVAYQSTLGIHHNIGSDLRAIQIKDDAINDERCDAYFATKEVTVKHKALTTGDIVLQRPYGKLRVIATDLAELNLNVDPGRVEVTYTAQHPQHFNAVTGDVTAFAEGDYGFSSTYNELFKDVAKGGLANHFYNAGYDSGSVDYSTVNADGVKRHTHMTLFTDYILGSNTVGEQTPVQFTMTVYDKQDNPIKTTQFNTTIPIERNHLTTIVGNVLTSATEITVTIDDNFANANDELTNNDYYQVVATDGYELVKAAMEQYKVILDGGVEENGNKLPITVTIKDFEKYFAELNTLAAQTTYTFPDGTEIDLNGYTLIIENNSDQPLIVVEDNKTLNIVDNSDDNKGKVILSGNDDSKGAAIQNNGTLNIEGVELESKTGGSVIDNKGETNIVDSTLNNGALTNNAEAEANIAGSTLNDGSVENNGMTNVNGGTVNEGAIENGDDATVGSYIKNAEGLQAEIEAAGRNGANNVLTLDADIEGDVTILQKEGVNLVIDGNGKYFDGTIKIHGDSRYTGAETLVIKNVKFKTSTKKDFIWSDNAQSSTVRYAHNITIKDCTFTGAAGVDVVGMRLRQAYDVVVEDCQAYNVHSLVQNSSANGLKINNVYVEGLTGINIPSSGNVEISNSTIIASEENGFAVRADGSNPGSMKISGCNFLAHRPVIVRYLTSTYNLAFEGTNSLNNYKTYQVILTNGKDDAYAVPTGTYTLTGAEDFVVFPHTWVVSDAAELQNAINSVKTDVKINFANNIEGNVYIPQKENIDIVIDGKDKEFDGGFIVDGKNRNEGAETILFKDINFYTESTNEKTFISCPSTYNGVNERYSHNVTIDGCTFRASSLTENVGAISAQKTYHLAVKNCEAYNIHSLLQVQSCDNDVTVQNVKVENCFSGISVGNTKTTSISGANIKTQKYGIRLDGETSRKVTVNVANSQIEAYIPIVARKVATNCNVEVNLSETTLVKKNSDMFDVVFQNNKDYEDGNVTPVAPTGNWKITGADDYIVYPRNYASTPAELKAAYNDANVKTLYLSSGKHTIELYTNAAPRESLTIIGTEGTQVEFSNQQVRMALFRNFTIENCEILHMATKSWGMLVFGGGDKADGVYTVKNCTFKGVGTQGIYINEDVSGATYNVLNCTFDGDFGSEGAVTIQNNTDVNFTVNVTGCTFNNVNDNNKIYMIGNYRGWTLNTDLTENEVNWSGSNPKI